MNNVTSMIGQISVHHALNELATLTDHLVALHDTGYELTTADQNKVKAYLQRIEAAVL